MIVSESCQQHTIANEVLLEQQYQQARESLSDEVREWLDNFVGAFDVSFSFDSSAYFEESL